MKTNRWDQGMGRGEVRWDETAMVLPGESMGQHKGQATCSSSIRYEELSRIFNSQLLARSLDLSSVWPSFVSSLSFCACCHIHIQIRVRYTRIDTRVYVSTHQELYIAIVMFRELRFRHRHATICNDVDFGDVNDLLIIRLILYNIIIDFIYLISWIFWTYRERNILDNIDLQKMS